jgi:hypothetical protein
VLTPVTAGCSCGSAVGSAALHRSTAARSVHLQHLPVRFRLQAHRPNPVLLFLLVAVSAVFSRLQLPLPPPIPLRLFCCVAIAFKAASQRPNTHFQTTHSVAREVPTKTRRRYKLVLKQQTAGAAKHTRKGQFLGPVGIYRQIERQGPHVRTRTCACRVRCGVLGSERVVTQLLFVRACCIFLLTVK